MSRITHCFDRAASDISCCDHLTGLAYSVHTVHCLRFCHWVPMRLNKVHITSRREINTIKPTTESAHAKRKANIRLDHPPFPSTANTCKHYGACTILFELRYCLASIRKTCLAVYSLKTELLFFNRLLD